MQTPEPPRRADFSMLAMLPDEAGFPLDMAVDEVEMVLYVACENGVYALNVGAGPRVLREFWKLEYDDEALLDVDWSAGAPPCYRDGVYVSPGK